MAAPIDRMSDAKRAGGWKDLPIYSDPNGDDTRDYVSAAVADPRLWQWTREVDLGDYQLTLTSRRSGTRRTAGTANTDAAPRVETKLIGLSVDRVQSHP